MILFHNLKMKKVICILMLFLLCTSYWKCTNNKYVYSVTFSQIYTPASLQVGREGGGTVVKVSYSPDPRTVPNQNPEQGVYSLISERDTVIFNMHFGGEYAESLSRDWNVANGVSIQPARCLSLPVYCGEPVVLTWKWVRLTLLSNDEIKVEASENTSGKERIMFVNSSDINIDDRGLTIIQSAE